MTLVRILKMLKLILITGLWINPMQITFMQDMGSNCKVTFTNERVKVVRVTCKEVEEIIFKEYPHD